jgi:8-oxo-dGTP diphosphatase
VSEVVTPRRPVVGVATLLIREAERTILLAERRAGKRQGWMNCPGGHLEWGESFEECAKREVAEETGIDLLQCEFLTAANGLALEEDHHYVMIYMLATKWEGEAQQMEEANGPWNWYDIPGPVSKMLPTTLIAICRYFERMSIRG